MEEKNEQDVVLEIKDRSLIVSASAGSGKTSTIIRKIFNTIFDNKVEPYVNTYSVYAIDLSDKDMQGSTAKKIYQWSK